MPEYVLSFKPAIPGFGNHDPSAVIFEDGELLFGIEEERLTREKHATNTFPEEAIRACLDHCAIELAEVDRVLLPYQPELGARLYQTRLRQAVFGGDTLAERLQETERAIENTIARKFFPSSITERVVHRLEDLGTPVPPIETVEHHLCHAASAFHPSDFNEALIVTIDGKGEYDSTVVWHGDENGLERIRTYEAPNSLGFFFGIVTEFLGYHAFNGEGKVMGLAPYGEANEAIEATLRNLVDGGVYYDVTGVTMDGFDDGVERLEAAFGRTRNQTRGEFDQWEKDFAHAAQAFLEDVVVEVVEHYVAETGRSNVGLAGGVALNCKMNKRVRESPAVDRVFVQPVAHDAGLAVGAGLIEQRPADVPPMLNPYWGPEYTGPEIRDVLARTKIAYEEPDDVIGTLAEALADGALVGWFQGRLEMGPRALGNRSILADPRTIDSMDLVNEYVKHREGWRPFAPSMLEEAIEDYLVDGVPSPFMIDTFEVKEERQGDIPAVLHPADGTTRPQTVRREQNPRYYDLISAFDEITGVPVVLNTSFNDHAEPIVNRPVEAIKDFFGMGLDVLALGDVLVGKGSSDWDRISTSATVRDRKSADE